MTASEIDFAHACECMDDMSDFALSCPLINARAELPLIACSSVSSDTYVGEDAQEA